jgi:hypothetical protein
MRAEAGVEHGAAMTNSTQLRFAAAGLVIGPLMFTLGDLFRRIVEPGGTFSDKQLADSVADQPGLWAAAALLSVLGAIFFLPGAAALFATARGRGAALTTTGAAMLALGLVASVGHAVGYYGPFARYADSGASAATIKSIEGAGGDPTIVLCIVLFMVGVMLGSIVLLIGLRRARRVPVWAVVAVVVFVVSGSSSGVMPGLLGIVSALVAFVPAARALLRESGDRHDDVVEQRASLQTSAS